MAGVMGDWVSLRTDECADRLVLVFDVARGFEPAEPWVEADLRRALVTTDELEATYWCRRPDRAAGGC